MPVLYYAANILGHHKPSDVETVHSDWCRNLLTVKNSTNLKAIYGELGRTSFYDHRKLILSQYRMKLIKSNRHTVLFKTEY